MPLAIPLPPGWGRAVLDDHVEDRGGTDGTARSYDHRGVRLVWHPPAELMGARRFACDFEHATRDASLMAARFGLASDEFLDAWVLTEVAAKLADQPILSWVKERGLVTPSLAGEGMIREFAPGPMTLLLVPNAPSGTHIALGFAPCGVVRHDARGNFYDAPAHSSECAPA